MFRLRRVQSVACQAVPVLDDERWRSPYMSRLCTHAKLLIFARFGPPGPIARLFIWAMSYAKYWIVLFGLCVGCGRLGFNPLDNDNDSPPSITDAMSAQQCDDSNGVCLETIAACVVTGSSRTCKCMEGYVGDGGYGVR
jgi:hypothetical protein